MQEGRPQGQAQKVGKATVEEVWGVVPSPLDSLAFHACFLFSVLWFLPLQAWKVR